MDQNLVGHVSHLESIEGLRSAGGAQGHRGIKAAMATPIWALAAAICRSAAATSGLLSRSSEGRPTGMGGGVAVRGEKGMEKSDAGFPTSIAIASSSCARCTPTLISWAWVVLSWVSAWSTSPLDETPDVYLFRVICKDLL